MRDILNNLIQRAIEYGLFKYEKNKINRMMGAMFTQKNNYSFVDVITTDTSMNSEQFWFVYHVYGFGVVLACFVFLIEVSCDKFKNMAVYLKNNIKKMF